jgi:hypothetical protein
MELRLKAIFFCILFRDGNLNAGLHLWLPTSFPSFNARGEKIVITASPDTQELQMVDENLKLVPHVPVLKSWRKNISEGFGRSH